MRVNTNAWNRIRYGLYAPVYDLVVRRMDRGRRRSIELLDLQPHERLLIVGAGTGLDFPHLRQKVDVTAVDLSGPMIRQAEARARSLGLDVSCRVMDAHALNLADAATVRAAAPPPSTIDTSILYGYRTTVSPRVSTLVPVSRR